MLELHVRVLVRARDRAGERLELAPIQQARVGPVIQGLEEKAVRRAWSEFLFWQRIERRTFSCWSRPYSFGLTRRITLSLIQRRPFSRKRRSYP